MTVSTDDLFNPPTAAEAKASIYDALGTVGVNTTAWRPGAVVRTIIAVVAFMFAAAARLISAIARGGFLETAQSVWLTLYARHVYGIERFDATFAAGTLTLTNTGGGLFDLDAGELIVRNPATDKTYTNVVPVHLAPNGVVTFSIIAQEAGAASTSAVGAITEFVTPLVNVTCTNPVALVGTDEEEDAALKVRCAEVLGSRSVNGPADAYAFAMRGAKRPDGSAIGVTRLRHVKDGKGLVRFYVATASGELTPEDLAIVRAAGERVAPEGVTVEVVSARAIPFDCQYRVWLTGTVGDDGAQVETVFLNAIARHLASVPVGGFIASGSKSEPTGGVWLDGVIEAINTARPDVFRVEFISPVPQVSADAGPDLRLGFDSVPVLGNVVALSIVESPQRSAAA